MRIKNLMALSLLTIFTLASCRERQDPTSILSTPETGKADSSPKGENPKSFEDMWNSLGTSVSLKGTYQLQISPDNLATSGSIDVTFNPSAYDFHDVNNDDEYYNIDMTVFENEQGKAVMKTLTKENTVQDLEVNDQETGEQYPFEVFKNPFHSSDAGSFTANIDGSYSLDVTTNEGNSIASRLSNSLTGFVPENFVFLDVFVQDERITQISAESNPYSDPSFGDVALIWNFTVEDTTKEIKGPEPYPSKDFAQALNTALDTLESGAGITFESQKTLKEGGDDSEPYYLHAKLVYSNDVFYLRNLDLPADDEAAENSYVVKDGYVRQVKHLTSDYVYDGYEYMYLSEEDAMNGTPATSLTPFLPSRLTPAEAFDYDEAKDVYKVSGDEARIFIASMSPSLYQGDTELTTTSAVEVKLSQDKSKVIGFAVETQNYTYAINYTYDTKALPFNVSTLKKWDPAEQLNGTYSGTLDNKEITVTIEAKDGVRKLTINGGEATEVDYQTATLTGTVGDSTYEFVRNSDGTIQVTLDGISADLSPVNKAQ